MYNKIEETIHFVFEAFKGKKRIKEDIELAFHSICVGTMLMEYNYNEEMVITGLLHDIIEDTKYDYDYLKDKYGLKIANNVLALSENKKISSFIDRKKEFIERVDKFDENLIIIELVDKLHNLISDYELYKKIGKEAVATKNTSYEMNKWYYGELKNIFINRIDEKNELLIRYNEIYNIYFEN